MKVLEFEGADDNKVLIKSGHVVSVEDAQEECCLLTTTNGRAFRVKGSLQEIMARLEFYDTPLPHAAQYASESPEYFQVHLDCAINRLGAIDACGYLKQIVDWLAAGNLKAEKPSSSDYTGGWSEDSRHLCMNDPSKVSLGSGFRRM